MLLLARAVEIALIASLVGYGAIFSMACLYRDGRAWAFWRASLFSGMVSTFGALLALLHAPVWNPRFRIIVIGLALVALGRFAGAFCNLCLAFHLRRLARPRRRGSHPLEEEP